MSIGDSHDMRGRDVLADGSFYHVLQPAPDYEAGERTAWETLKGPDKVPTLALEAYLRDGDFCSPAGEVIKKPRKPKSGKAKEPGHLLD